MADPTGDAEQPKQLGRRQVLGMIGAVTGVALVGACSDDEPSGSASQSPTEPPSRPPTRTATPTPSPTPTPTPVAFDTSAAYAVVEHLAGQIGPREAASAAFDEAAAYVQARFEALGYTVVQTDVAVPAGDSSGGPGGAGAAPNLVAGPPRLAPA